MRVKSVPITSVVLDPANVRRHPTRNLEAIKGSLARFGQQKPIVIDQNGVVRAGNGTLEAARALGWKTIQVVQTNLAGSEATAFAIADNRTGELAEWDNDLLREQVGALAADGINLESLGFSTREVEKLFEAAVQAAEAADADGDTGEGGDEPATFAAAPAGAPSERKYPLAVVVNRQDLALWQAWKAEQGESDDSRAFVLLLELTRAEG